MAELRSLDVHPRRKSQSCPSRLCTTPTARFSLRTFKISTEAYALSELWCRLSRCCLRFFRLQPAACSITNVLLYTEVQTATSVYQRASLVVVLGATCQMLSALLRPSNYFLLRSVFFIFMTASHFDSNGRVSVRFNLESYCLRPGRGSWSGSARVTPPIFLLNVYE